MYTDITISDASFRDEASYLALEPPRNIRYGVAIEIQIKPTSASGLILYVAEHFSSRTSDFLSVELHNGWFQLRYNTGSDGPTVVRSSGRMDTNTGLSFCIFIGYFIGYL